MQTHGTANNLVANYWNEYTTRVRLGFTMNETIDNVQIYGLITDSNLSSCDQNGFTGSALEIGTGNGSSITGTIWGNTFNNTSSYYVEVYPSEIYSTLGANNQNFENKTGKRLYLGLKFNSSNSKWSCPTADDGDGNSLNSVQADGNGRRYIILDRIEPTLSSITDGNDKSLNSSSSTTTSSSNFTNSNQIKITTGSEAVAKINATWTKDSGDGASIAETQIFGSTGANSAAGTATQNSLVNNTRYDIRYDVYDAAGNIATYYDYNINFDNVAPTVVGVFNEDGDGTRLAQGEQADFYVEFSEGIDFTGTPTLTIRRKSDANASVNCASCVDGATKAYFDYTVQDGDYSPHLDYVNHNSLSGTMKDYAGNALANCAGCSGTLPSSPASFGDQASGSAVANKSLSNALTGGSLEIDGNDPADFSVGAVVTQGNNVVSGKWNSTNQNVQVTIPASALSNDPTLEAGTIQLRVEADGSFENIGSAYTIQNSDLGSLKNLTVTKANVEAITGYSQDDELTWNAIITDRAGNATTGTASGTTLDVDVSSPTVDAITSTAGYYKLNESVNIVVSFTENIAITGTPQLVMKTDNSPGSGTATIDKSGLSGDNVTFAYTVGSTHYSTALDYATPADDLKLNSGTITDAAGNNATLTLPNTGTLPGQTVVRVDGIVPDAFNTGTVVTIGDSVVAGYLNADNTGIDVTVPVANDASLENGKLYIQAKIGGNAFANVTSAYTIQSSDKGSNKTIRVNESDIDSNSELTGFAEGAVISFAGLLEDYADGPSGTGNQTVGAASGTTLTVDQTDPASPAIASITTVGGAVVSGKWNKDNTSAVVTVNIANDATLEGGKVQILAKKNSGSYEGVGNSLAITNRNINGTLDVTLLAAHIEGVDSGVAENDVLTFKVKIYDVAGNHTTGNDFGTTMTIDQDFPTVVRVTSDDDDTNPLGVGESLNIKVVFSEDVIVDVSSGTKPHLTLDLANAPGDANGNAIYQSGSGTSTLVFKYDVVANNYNTDTNYLNTTSLEKNDGTIRDAAGNNADPRLKATDDANALAVYNSKDFWIDGVAPADDQVEDVLTVGTTQKAGWWNASNTAATVKVPLSTSDISLVGGTVQIQAKTDANNFADIGSANAISSAEKTAGFKTVSLTATQIEGIAGYSNQVANPDVISFTAIVTDKAGNSTTYTASASTLTVDETAPSAFAVDTVFTIGGEICWDDDKETTCYYNEDNTTLTIQVPIANDASLEGGYVAILAEADNTYERIGPGSQNGSNAYNDTDFPSSYWSMSTVTSSAVDWVSLVQNDLSTEKDISIIGNPTGNKMRDFESITGFSDGDEVNFKAIIMDRAGNTTLSSVSPTPLTIDQTDPPKPTIELKNSSDTGIADWDNLTSDFNPTFTIGNVSNTDSVFLKVATDVNALAQASSIVVREKTTSNTRDLTSPNYANNLYKISAMAKDVAGNWSVDATATFVRIDTIPPSIPNAPDLLTVDDTGFKNNDNITKTQQPHFILKGLSATKDSLRLVIDNGGSTGRDSIMSQVSVDTFKVAAALADGYHTAGVIAIDSAGNIQNISTLLPFVVDATPPSTPTAPDMTAATDFGQSNTDNFTNTQKPNFTITNIEVGSFINLYGFVPTPVDTTLFDFDTVKTGVTTLTMVPDNNIPSPTNAATGLGEYTLYATSEDTAGNISESTDLSGVLIDITKPEISTHYYNKTIQTVYNGFANKFKADSVRFGKGGDELELIAKLSEPASTNPEPTLSVTYGSNSSDSFTAKAKTSKSNNDSTFTWKFDLPKGSKNDGIAVISFTAFDRAGNKATSFTDTQKFVIDNTLPAEFTTGLASAGSFAGSAVDTTVFKINNDGVKYWYMNKGADTINVLIDLPANDATLLGGGYVDIQARVRNRMLTEWLSIETRDSTNPFAKQDSIKGLGVGKIFTRNKNNIIDPLTAKGLIQGDTIDFRARIYDRSLNARAGLQSPTYFVLDTLPPLHNNTPSIAKAQTTNGTLKNVKGNSVFLTILEEKIFSSDSLSFAFRSMYDPVKTNEKKSDLQRYEYKIEETPSSAEANWALFRDWRSAASKTTNNADSILMLLDTVFLDTFALTHNRNYRAVIRGIDQAGNISSDFTTSSVLRFNDKPIIDSIPDALAKEDILWEKIITITDKDVATLRTDSFTFRLESYFLRDTNNTKTDGFYTFKNPKIDSLNAKITPNTGYFTFTPDKWDTTNVKSRGGYIHRIFAKDLWGFDDTLDIKMVVEAVNDPPKIDLSSLDMFKFLEGTESDTFNLSRFVTDEDDSTHTLTYSANIKTSLKPVDGYPLFAPYQKLIFLSPISKKAKKSYINQLIDENPSSTIIQEDNAFLVYNKGINEFADPLTVKTVTVDDRDKFSPNNTNKKDDDSTYAWIKPLDLDYFNKDTMIVEFTVKDSSLASGVSTIAFAINPLNDVPVWSSDWFKDTVITENDSLFIDFGKYLKDVDDDSLKISIIPTTYKSNILIDTTLINANNDSGYVYISGGLNDTIKFKPQELWFETDGIYQNKSISSLWNPLDQKSNKIEFKITAADDSTTEGIDTTFTITVQRVPRPEISMYVVQNNAFTNFYEIFIVDSLEKTKEVTLEFGENNPMPLDTAAAYMWYSHIYFRNAGSYFLDVKAKGAVGDTVVNVPLGVVMSFATRSWEGKSADGVFKVKGNPGAVDFDQSIMIVDSTLFEPYFNDKASYLMGNESLRLVKPVEVSMAGDREELAIYRRSTGAGWEELPSITRNGRIVAFTDRMGYFRKGPKTIIVPGQTSLNQNYPNPFNPSTTIEYDLGFGDGPSQRVNLNIYDILGRTVKTLLFNEDQTIGRYQIRWDGKDENNVPVSSGVYFVYLQTDKGRTYTKKIMLMR